jgi:hypothetical protein
MVQNGTRHTATTATAARKVIGMPERMPVCVASRPNQSVLLDGGVPEKVAIG